MIHRVQVLIRPPPLENVVHPLVPPEYWALVAPLIPYGGIVMIDMYYPLVLSQNGSIKPQSHWRIRQLTNYTRRKVPRQVPVVAGGLGYSQDRIWSWEVFDHVQKPGCDQTGCSW